MEPTITFNGVRFHGCMLARIRFFLCGAGWGFGGIFRFGFNSQDRGLRDGDNRERNAL